MATEYIHIPILGAYVTEGDGLHVPILGATNPEGAISPPRRRGGIISSILLPLMLPLALPFLMGQTLRDVTVRDVVVGVQSGGTEQMLPTTLSDVTASSWRTGAVANVADCNGSEATCLGYVDEGYQATYDDERMCNDENVAPPTDTIRFDFNTPSNAPSATTDAQSIRVATIRTSATCVANAFNTADPTYDIQVYDGTSVTLIADDISCTDHTAVAEATYSWTYTGGGSGSEVYVVWIENGNTQTGTNRRRCALEAIDWLEAY